MNCNITFSYFTEKLLARLKCHYGENYDITISEVIKNNGRIRHSVLIRKEGDTLTPNIYIDDMYDDYIEGSTFAQITSDIIYFRERYYHDTNINLDFLDDYELVKDKLGIKLVGKEYNTEILTDVPHTDFADLTVMYYVKLENEDIGAGSILIHNNMMKNWDITLERLHFDARNNMMRENPPYKVDIIDLLIDLYRNRNNDGTEFAKEEISDYINMMEESREIGPKMFVLTNQEKWYGASVLVYPGMLEELGESFGSDFIVLPSSIHEVILIAYDKEELGLYFTEMVESVNQDVLNLEDILSNHAYRYHRDTHWLEPLTI